MLMGHHVWCPIVQLMAHPAIGHKWSQSTPATMKRFEVELARRIFITS